MKKTLPILAMSLTAAMAVGVGINLSRAATQADALTGTTRFYLDLGTFDASTNSKGFSFHVWDGNDHTFYFSSLGEKVYYVDVDWNGIEFTQLTSQGFKISRIEQDNSWTQMSWYGNWDGWSTTTVNYFKATANNNGEWGKINDSWSLSGTHSDTSALSIAISKENAKSSTDGIEFYDHKISLRAGDTFKIGDLGFAELSTANNMSAREKGLLVEGANNTIVVSENGTGEYDVFVNAVANTVWIQEDSESEANNFATKFKSAFSCDSDGINEPSFKIKEGETYWSWDLLAQEYGNLTNDAKDILYEGGASLSAGAYKTNISDAVNRYDWIVYNHGYTKFVKNSSDVVRNVTPVAGGLSTTSYIKNAENDSSAYAIALVSVALAGLVGGVFFLRKKKEQ